MGSNMSVIEFPERYISRRKEILLKLGPVNHARGPNSEHRYLVDGKQLKLLNKEGIAYKVVKQFKFKSY